MDLSTVDWVAFRAVFAFALLLWRLWLVGFGAFLGSMSPFLACSMLPEYCRDFVCTDDGPWLSDCRSCLLMFCLYVLLV